MLRSINPQPMALEDKGEEMLSSVNQANVDQQQPEGNDEAEQKK